jgi:hypothetical protein
MCSAGKAHPRIAHAEASVGTIDVLAQSFKMTISEFMKGV